MVIETREKPTAAIVLIGDELLSGKIEDENGRLLIAELRTLGVCLKELRMVPDDLEAIAECIAELASRVDYLFTSGGIGPTHDDITLEGVAKAFDLEMVEDAELVRHIEETFAGNEEKRDAFMKMAWIPDGMQLIQDDGLFWPIYRYRDIFVLPGIPEIFRKQFAFLRDRFQALPFFLRTLFFTADEGHLSSIISEAVRHFETISFGSYPVLNNPDYKVRVTIESKDKDAVEQAYQWLVEQTGGGLIYKVVDGS